MMMMMIFLIQIIPHPLKKASKISRKEETLKQPQTTRKLYITYLKLNRTAEPRAMTASSALTWSEALKNSSNKTDTSILEWNKNLRNSKLILRRNTKNPLCKLTSFLLLKSRRKRRFSRRLTRITWTQLNG